MNTSNERRKLLVATAAKIVAGSALSMSAILNKTYRLFPYP